MSIKNKIRKEINELYPGYFAIVMATGIISIGSYFLKIDFLPWLLFLLNIILYISLWIFTFFRIVYYSRKIVTDLTSHLRGAGFFTLVAGTNILGSQFIILEHNYLDGFILAALGTVLWFLLMYAYFTAIIVSKSKPTLEEGINGGWLNAVVATQSVSIIFSLLTPDLVLYQDQILFFTLFMYLGGCMLYILIIALIFYRFNFFRFDPRDLTPPYWINMGAVAITTLAGSRIILNISHWQFFTEILPFVIGFTLFFWSTATWWIPLIFILGIWRHIYNKVPLEYDPQYWGLVFPTGMYTVCTIELSIATGLSFLMIIPDLFIFIALIAWISTFFGFIHRIQYKIMNNNLNIGQISKSKFLEDINKL